MSSLASIVRIYPWLYHANMSRLSTIYALFTIHYHLVIIICVVNNLSIIIYLYSILSYYILSILLHLFTTPIIFHIFPPSRGLIVFHPWSVDQQHYLLKSLPFLLSFSYCLYFIPGNGKGLNRKEWNTPITNFRTYIYNWIRMSFSWMRAIISLS